MFVLRRRHALLLLPRFFAAVASCALAAALVPSVPGAQPRHFAVTDYGAAAGSAGLNTAAIQAAIDAAAAQGGGLVVIPAGVFRSGSIFLKAGVGLHLEAGAVLQGSENIEDYPLRMTRIEGHFQQWRMALVNAQGIDGLQIDGAGTLDGSGKVYWTAFWKRRKENPQCTNVEVQRPRLMFIDRCTHVRIAGITLQNSGFWNLHLYRCANVVVEGVGIFAPFAPIHAASSDGIDIDSSHDVTVRRCRIAVDDDCIALKGSKGPLADHDADSPPVENILVEQCEFGHGNGVLTCGSEATVVRNALVRNCTVTGYTVVVCLKLRPDTPQLYENLTFDGIRLSGGSGRLLQVLPWKQFFDLEGHAPPVSTVRNIVVRNVSGDFGSFGFLDGNPGDTIEDVTLENIQINFGQPKLEVGKVDRLIFRNVQVNGQPMAAPVKS
jgi:polygalacturonase